MPFLPEFEKNYSPVTLVLLSYTEAVRGSGPESRNGSFPQLLISLSTRWPISLPISRGEEDFFPACISAPLSHPRPASRLCGLTAWRGENLPLAALPLASPRALFWKSHPLYLGRETQLLSPTMRAISHTAIHRRTSANSDGVFPENCVRKLVSWI